jgi:hypothetical protein
LKILQISLIAGLIGAIAVPTDPSFAPRPQPTYKRPERVQVPAWRKLPTRPEREAQALWAMRSKDLPLPDAPWTWTAEGLVWTAGGVPYLATFRPEDPKRVWTLSRYPG